MNISLKLKCMIVLGAFVISSFAIGGVTMNASATTASTSSSNALPVISFSTGTQTTNTLANMIKDFNANFSQSYGFTVKLDSAAFETTSQHDTYVAAFQAHSTAYDVISMDVIWPAEFASAGYIIPLTSIINSTNSGNFLQAPIEAGTVNGTHYGVPWFHDSAMLYYRTDVLAAANSAGVITDSNGAPPTTWAQLENWSVAIMNNAALVKQFNLTAGFVWQGKSYEGLMCDFMEYIGGTGTYSFLNSGQTAATFTTQSGISSAMQFMRSLITSGASPKSVLTYDEEGSRAVWNAGSAVFMRNWPYAYALSLNSQQLNGSLVTGAQADKQQFNVTTMPAANATMYNSGNARTSCLGGWQLGVSAYSTHKDDAKRFISWMTNESQQITYFLGAGETPTLKAAYSSPLIANSKQSYVTAYLPVFEHALPRPVSPLYTTMSAEIAPTLNNYLGGGISLSAALSKLETDTNNVINPPAPTSAGYSAPLALLLVVFGLGTLVTIRKRKQI